MELEVYQQRSGLHRLRQALARGAVTLGFMGGSITDPMTGSRWPEPVIAWFTHTYPQVRFSVENAAIGATGSDLGVFRAGPDIIDYGCDLVFIEYAVNDFGTPPVQRMRSREGLLRKLLNQPRDLLITYTFMQEMYADMAAGQVPQSIADFEKLAAHYRVPSVWMGLHALNECRAGFMRWEEWLPDGLHPEQRGSLSYAQSVIALLEKDLAHPSPALAWGKDLPAPLDPHPWEHTHFFPFDQVTLAGPWTVRRWPASRLNGPVLFTSAVGARMSFSFEGRGLVLGFDFGKNSSEFRYRLDGADWITTNRERPWWVGAAGWYRSEVIADDLLPATHTIEIEVTHGGTSECKGTNFQLTHIGVIE